MAEEELHHPRAWELRSLPQTAVFVIIGLRELFRAAGDDVGGERALALAQAGEAVQAVEDLPDAFLYVLRPLPVGLGGRLQDFGEAGNAVAVFGGKIGAAVERFFLRGEKDGHRPAAPSGKHL